MENLEYILIILQYSNLHYIQDLDVHQYVTNHRLQLKTQSQDVKDDRSSKTI